MASFVIVKVVTRDDDPSSFKTLWGYTMILINGVTPLTPSDYIN